MPAMTDNNYDTDDEEDNLEHSDSTFLKGLDDDIRRMSADAMFLLNSITDEVNEIPDTESSSSTTKRQSTARKSTSINDISGPRAANPSTPENSNQRPDDNTTTRTPIFTPTPQKTNNKNRNNKIVHIDDLDIDEKEEHENDDSDAYSLSDDDHSLDDSISNELSALRDIQREIERELKLEDEATMQEAMNQLLQQTSPQSIRSTRSSINTTNKYSTMATEDREIIERILHEEQQLRRLPPPPMSSPPPLRMDTATSSTTTTTTSKPSRNWLEILLIDTYHLYGPGVGGQELNVQLLAGAIVIWSLVLLLGYRERNAVY
jgi:hypothetical protein